MNKLLASSIAVLNQLLALVFILIGSLIGLRDDLGILGGFLGFVVAVIVCGTLALLVDIRNELKSIRQELSYRNSS